ncbi:TMAO reductase system sensor histidine kinase/response regulator TorS [Vibrio sp. 03-59-1]|uniref:TMAO reductase system sensor histidine kinase/response regulator TorS n=1 Tax=Vibrio sp. 03-59-1 TaxID=2607607 RepID=UPI001493A794|nr:TMAO reductase system sensor histidine kinase/response regulator TorS [Vibrio sp. 03-59-1]NOH82805.1 TMAO reductase system sensor histidine kinase/response regulator TorS [Vibrio sp. 03-59-1]
MLLATASIGRKLLFSFLIMALLVLLSALIGASGFSFVAKTERNVVDSAIPAMIEARQVSELSSRIISSVQTLSNAKNEQERKASGKMLFEQLESLLTHIKALGSDSFDSGLLTRLENNVESVINTLAELGITVEKKLWLSGELHIRVEEMRKLSAELEQLTRTQVLNTSTIAVANVTHIYDLLENKQTEKVYQALDALVEVDLDLSERLHELHLLAFKMLNQIEEARTVTNIERIQIIQSEFQDNLKIMMRRVRAVEDPTRSKQMTALLVDLGKRQVVFDILMEKYENEQQSQFLMQNTLSLFSELNNTVNSLVDESNLTTTKAVEELTKTLNYAQLSLSLISIIGLIIAVIIVWKVVYISVVKRLTEYSSALLSIAQGHLDVTIHVKGNDELAHMGQAIVTARNTAQALQVVAEGEAQAKRDLEEHKEHLEELVTDRTHQLQKTNQRLNVEVLNHAKARSLAEQASRAKSAFLATMSHEIRTPMNGVLGTAHLLKDSGLDPLQGQYVDIINRSGKNLLAILNDILDYSKIEAGHLEIRESSFNLHHMVDDAFQLMQSRAQEKHLAFYQHIESDVAKYWRGDVTRISQVLNNLVGNAIKFTERGEVDIYVSMDVDNDKRVMFEVSDSGIGIGPEEQRNLFDPFTQASGGINSTGGTGLGLAISKRIIEAMDAELHLESNVGEGSRFWFSLELQPGEKVDIPSVTSLNTVIKAKVLLVEDNPVNCLVAEGFLSNLGHEVVTAETGAEAEQIFESQHFDIALLDINLPDCNGVDLLGSLKAIEKNKEITLQAHPTPMVAVSAHVFNEEVESYLSSGFDGYLPKPLDKDALAALIQSTLDGKSLVLPQLDEEGVDSLNRDDCTMHESVSSSDEKITPNEIRVIDVTVIEGDMSILGRDKMREIVGLFVTSSRDVLVSLQVADNADDYLEVKSLAHKLKGSAGSLGLKRLFHACMLIESAGEPLVAYRKDHETLANLVEQSIEALNTTIG